MSSRPASPVPASSHLGPAPASSITENGIPLYELISIIERLYPPILAEEWDSIGLTVGHPHQLINHVLLAVDPTETVVDQAIKIGANLVLTHHPLYLRPVHSFAAHTTKGDVAHRLASHGVALYNAHTNADSAPRGVAEALAEAIGLKNLRPLVPHPLAEVSDTSDPLSGKIKHGIGRVGDLPYEMTLAEFAQSVVRSLPATAQAARVAGDLTAAVRRVAVVGGAGDTLFDAVRTHSVDVYVTSDLRHHPASEERERAKFESRFWPDAKHHQIPYLVDISHFASEWPWLNLAAADLAAACQAAGYQVEFTVSKRNTDPWNALVGPAGVITRPSE